MPFDHATALSSRHAFPWPPGGAVALCLVALSTLSCRGRSPQVSGHAGAEVSAEAFPQARTQSAARAVSGGYAFTPAETGTIDDFLKRNPTLRVARDADRRAGKDGDSELKSLYGIYHPYFLRGDVNDDGVLDLVVGFVRRDVGTATPWFSVVVFTGRDVPGGPGTFSSGTFLERDISLARGDLSVDRDSIVISPDLEDETVRRYHWDLKAHTFVLVRDRDDDSDSPSVSQTSARIGARPRAPRG
ncbi:MAG: hypothetical protein ABR610_16225 [Thermoanaerobaculia bacterium]